MALCLFVLSSSLSLPLLDLSAKTRDLTPDYSFSLVLWGGQLSEVKKQIRLKLRCARARAFHEDQAHGGTAAGRLADMGAALVEEVTADVVAGYVPISNEIDPRQLMASFAAAGARLCLPEVVESGAALRFREWTPGALLTSGKLGTLQPLAEADELVPDVLLVPLLGVDHSGVRLGQGGGFFDRTLEGLRQGPAAKGAAKMVKAFGVAFDDQIVDSLPVESHDQLLDGLLTPSACILWDENRQRRFLAQR